MAFVSAFTSLIPMIGGSGGGGGGSFATTTAPTSGGSGGGGGGALVICSGTTTVAGSISITGTVSANGGTGGAGLLYSSGGGGGGGGAIRLISDSITGSGFITALSGAGGVRGASQTSTSYDGKVGINGIVKSECFTCSFTGTITAATNSIGQPAPVFPNPIPTLKITSIGGVAPPATTTGSLTTPDIVLASTVVNPVTIVVSATNIPTTANVTVYNYPTDASYRVNMGSGSLQGSITSSSFTASGTLPPGVSILMAESGSFTVTASLAPLLPKVDGEEITEMLASASMDGQTTLTGITGSGKHVSLVVDGDKILLASNAPSSQKE